MIFPRLGGHYSQAIVANGLVFVSRQLPIVPGPERRIPDGIEAQAAQVFANLRAILETAGSGLDRLVNVQIFVPDMELWGSVNAVYRDWSSE